MNWLKNIWRWILGYRRDLSLRFIIGDTPPESVKRGHLVVARENGECWAAALLCPCGCNDRLEVALIPDVTPHWRLTVSKNGAPNLFPSVWRKTGCLSHFWVREGRIVWCRE